MVIYIRFIIELELNQIHFSLELMKKLMSEIQMYFYCFFLNIYIYTLYQATEDPMPWGEYGPYCPVTLKDEGWLVPGNQEKVAFVQGQKH